MKCCSRCKGWKPAEGFHRCSKNKDGLQNKCKPCHIFSVGLAQKKNPIAKQATNRRYRELHPDRCKASDAQWRAKDPKKASALAASRARAWRSRNPDAVREITSRSRLSQKQATPGWADMTAIRRVYREAKKRGLEVDHIVPINSDVVCGLHVHANLQLLDGLLNKSKGNKLWPDAP